MASLTKDRRLLFKAPDGKRKTIRLGKIPVKQAQLIQRHVERLIACQLDGSAPPDETSRWVSGISDALRDRLVRGGLLQPKGAATIHTLGGLIDEFKRRPKWHDKKPSSQVFQEKAFRYLVDHFGRDPAIGELTESQAEDYHAHLQLPKAKGGRGLAVSTGNRQCAVAWTLYRYAIRSRYLDRNPFDDVPRGMPRTDCNVNVPADIASKVLAELPGSQWQLLFALSRWAGLRVPSEPRRLRWCDVDWEQNRFLVHCSKTERHAGHETRWVPIFPEIATLLDTRFSEAAEGDELVLPFMVGLADSTFASNVLRAVKRADVERWARTWHSMRATRHTELEREFPSHVVCSWLGNSTAVARRHYLQVTDDDFAKASQVAQNATQHTPAQPGIDVQTENAKVTKSL